MTGLFLRYCERHRFAWPINDLWKLGDPCPRGKEIGGRNPPPCEITSVDAATKIDELGREIEFAEYED